MPDYIPGQVFTFKDDEAVTFQFAVPDDWTPGLSVTFAELIDKAMGEGFPLVVPIRRDATPDQVNELFKRIRTLVRSEGMAASQAIQL
jgi:hypothetical protein